jgi:exodeoxyribonuclease-3
MKVVTWNVNSINVRLPNILKYLNDYKPDVLCLQELKCLDEKYPLEALNDVGYESVQSCQKTYNGVSIISKVKGENIDFNPVNITDDEKRSISGTYHGIRIINFYVVNGQAVDSEKYQHKLAWLKKAYNYIAEQLKLYPKLIVLGDFNIVPRKNDAHNFSSDDILCSDKERDSLESIINLGLNDCYNDDMNESPYTWWDYRGGAFHRDIGYRIDLLLASKKVYKSIKKYEVNRDTRHKSWCMEQSKTSDHAPVMIEIENHI